MRKLEGVGDQASETYLCDADSREGRSTFMLSLPSVRRLRAIERSSRIAGFAGISRRSRPARTGLATAPSGGRDCVAIGAFEYAGLQGGQLAQGSDRELGVLRAPGPEAQVLHAGEASPAGDQAGWPKGRRYRTLGRRMDGSTYSRRATGRRHVQARPPALTPRQ